jgi:hypothetical protein
MYKGKSPVIPESSGGWEGERRSESIFSRFYSLTKKDGRESESLPASPHPSFVVIFWSGIS